MSTAPRIKSAQPETHRPACSPSRLTGEVSTTAVRATASARAAVVDFKSISSEPRLARTEIPEQIDLGIAFWAEDVVRFRIKDPAVARAIRLAGIEAGGPPTLDREMPVEEFRQIIVGGMVYDDRVTGVNTWGVAEAFGVDIESLAERGLLSYASLPCLSKIQDGLAELQGELRWAQEGKLSTTQLARQNRRETVELLREAMSPAITRDGLRGGHATGLQALERLEVDLALVECGRKPRCAEAMSLDSNLVRLACISRPKAVDGFPLRTPAQVSEELALTKLVLGDGESLGMTEVQLRELEVQARRLTEEIHSLQDHAFAEACRQQTPKRGTLISSPEDALAFIHATLPEGTRGFLVLDSQDRVDAIVREPLEGRQSDWEDKFSARLYVFVPEEGVLSVFGYEAQVDGLRPPVAGPDESSDQADMRLQAAQAAYSKAIREGRRSLEGLHKAFLSRGRMQIKDYLVVTRSEGAAEAFSATAGHQIKCGDPSILAYFEARDHAWATFNRRVSTARLEAALVGGDWHAEERLFDAYMGVRTHPGSGSPARAEREWAIYTAFKQDLNTRAEARNDGFNTYSWRGCHV